jgi:hypothetical protein
MKYGNYKFVCRFTSRAMLPGYKGSTFRGLFGHALKRVVCALKQQACDSCILRERCLYFQVFENTDDGEGKNSRPVSPHPFVIEPPLTGKTFFDAGDAFDCNLILFGEYVESLPYFIYAFDQMGRIGIGKRLEEKRGRFQVDRVLDREVVVFKGGEGKLERSSAIQHLNPQPAEPPLQVSRLGLVLETPLRLKFNNRLQADLPFHVLVRTMLRRISTLMAAFGGGEPDLDYKGLVNRAEAVRTVDNRLTWYDWKRYSNRQQQQMLMGGITGSVVYEGDLGPYLPLVRFCEQTHIGKQTAFGLGKIGFMDDKAN